MNNQPTPPSSSSPPKREFRLELNNWLQFRGWRKRLTSSLKESVTKEDNGENRTTWLAVYKFDDRVYGESRSFESAKEAKEEAARIAYRRLLWEEAKLVLRNQPGS